MDCLYKGNGTFYQQVGSTRWSRGRSFAVTDGLSDATEPVFDRGGKYLYFLASTDAGPVINWFDQSNADMEMTRSDLPGHPSGRNPFTLCQRER